MRFPLELDTGAADARIGCQFPRWYGEVDDEGLSVEMDSDNPGAVHIDHG